MSFIPGEAKDLLELGAVLEKAIQREQDAYFFYQDLLKIVKDESVKEILEWIAEEEIKHREFLVRYRNSGAGPDSLRTNHPIDYKIAEYILEPEITPDMASHDIYLIASHRERNSHMFYTGLADLHQDGDVKNLLLKFASEELKHKEKMEYLYANTAFPQTAGG